MKGFVMQLQNFSVNDGDGIRTTVFLAGCPLKCQWCANPEGLSVNVKMAYYKRLCIGCGKCEKACNVGIGIDFFRDADKCVACGNCVKACPTGARKLLVEKKTVAEVVDAIKPQIPFFRASGGGVTFSGGEATLQQQFLRKLANELYDLGVSLAIETCAYFDFDSVSDILSLMDLIFVDIKHMNTTIHKHFTGVDNTLILQNIARLSQLKAKVVVRVPVIENVNNDDENILLTAEFIKNTLPHAAIELLPYHSYGDVKYEALNLNPPGDSFKTPSYEGIRHLEEIIKNAGVTVVSYK